MKDGLVKIWVCQNCNKEYVNRPIMCTGCDTFGFYVKYGGFIDDTNELTKLVDAYRDDSPDRPKAPPKSKKPDIAAKPGKDKKVRL